MNLSLVFWSTTCLAGQVISESSWQKVWADGQAPKGNAFECRVQTDTDALVVTKTGSEPATLTILTLEAPKITTSTYALAGRVRYQGVEGEAYLEMWSHFPGGQKYYSRTRESAGPMRMLTGSSDWREFVLPFHSKPQTPPPAKLVLNLVLPAGGEVVVGPVRLVEYVQGEDPLLPVGAWWSDRTAGLLGGILGTLLGCLGALVGCLTATGKAQGTVMGILKGMAVVGALSLIAGLVALVRSQPYAVWYPLVLVGFLCGVLGFLGLRVVSRRYRELEIRKMAAMDAG